MLCYKGIDYMNNKEIRRSIFSIILHIMDSFENITSDMDFVVLFIYSIDFQNIIINKNVDSPSSIYELINCRLESTFFMGDIPKLFKENSNQHSVSIEEFSRVFHSQWHSSNYFFCLGADYQTVCVYKRPRPSPTAVARAFQIDLDDEFLHRYSVFAENKQGALRYPQTVRFKGIFGKSGIC